MATIFKRLLLLLIIIVLVAVPVLSNMSCTTGELINLLIRGFICGVEVYVDGNFQGTTEWFGPWLACVLMFSITEAQHTLDLVVPAEVIASKAMATTGMPLDVRSLSDITTTIDCTFVDGGRYEVRLGLETSNLGLETSNRDGADLSTIIVEVSKEPFEPNQVHPADGATNVPIDTSISATFLGPMDSSTITSYSFTLSDGGAVDSTVTYDSGTYTAAFTPSVNLSCNTTYTASLSTAITDAAGNPLASAYSWSFTTTSELPSGYYPCLFYGTATVGDEPVAADTEITAWVEVEQVGLTHTGEGDLGPNEFTLTVQLEPPADVSFKIGELDALVNGNETIPFEQYGAVEANLAVPPSPIPLWEGANPIYYTGATTDLPEALTNISEITEIIWERDISTDGEWWSYLVAWDYGQISHLENGKVYIIVVSEYCEWELPH